MKTTNTDDTITQKITGTSGTTYDLHYSITGLQKLLGEKSAPLTPAERILSSLLSQPKPIDVKGSFGEYWEFGSECRKIEAAIQRLQRLTSIFRPDGKPRQIRLPESAAYAAGHQLVDKWVDVHENELVEWFSANRDTSLENATKIAARAKEPLTRRSLLEKAVNVGVMYVSSQIFLTAISEMLANSGKGLPKAAAGAVTFSAAASAESGDESARREANQHFAELMKLDKVIHQIDGYIFESIAQRHPEIVPPAPLRLQIS